LKEGVLKSEVNFPNREVDVIYNESEISLRSTVEMHTAIGYRPKLDLDAVEGKRNKNPNRSLYIKLGVAGFSFGNLMMLAFPEYLSSEGIEPEIQSLINWLNMLFILPLLYAGSDYLKSAYYVLTAILIIACPCALALTLPFTYSSTMRVYGRNNFFIKSDSVVEFLSNITGFVFDKTGTLTKSAKGGVVYKGKDFSKYEPLIRAATSNSTHPVSSMMLNYLQSGQSVKISKYEELPGKGIIAESSENKLRLGSAKWLTPDSQEQVENAAMIEINGEVYGSFQSQSEFRDESFVMLDELGSDGYYLSIVSGDNTKDEQMIANNAPKGTVAEFDKLPHEKLEYIESLQKNEQKIAMVGDGLNDAGALAKAEVGIAIAEKTNNFTPGSDAILLGEEIGKLPKLMRMSKSAIKIAYSSIGISFLYNTVGITFAAKGLLSPIVAAILMPISSISVIVFTVSAENIVARMKKL